MSRGGSRGGGRGGRGGFRPGGGMSFQQHVPSFIQQMLARHPNVRLQGQRSIQQQMLEEDGATVAGFDAMARQIIMDGGNVETAASSASSSSSAAVRAARQQSEAEGRDRPDRDDEAPIIANLDEYADRIHQLKDILPEASIKRATDTTAIDPSLSAHPANTGKKDEPAASTSGAVGLSLSESRLMSVKRARESNPDADRIEAETGRHIFRPAAKGNKGNTDNDNGNGKEDENAGMSAEEIARRKKRKKEEQKKKKSKLTFDEEDI